MLVKAKISKGGKISIPVLCKKILKVSDGDELLFNIKDDQVTISPIKTALSRVRKILKEHNPENRSLVNELLQERKLAAAKE